MDDSSLDHDGSSGSADIVSTTTTTVGKVSHSDDDSDETMRKIRLAVTNHLAIVPGN
jgi:hypothetical protein